MGPCAGFNEKTSWITFMFRIVIQIMYIWKLGTHSFSGPPLIAFQCMVFIFLCKILLRITHLNMYTGRYVPAAKSYNSIQSFVHEWFFELLLWRLIGTKDPCWHIIIISNKVAIISPIPRRWSPTVLVKMMTLFLCRYNHQSLPEWIDDNLNFPF